MELDLTDARKNEASKGNTKEAGAAAASTDALLNPVGLDGLDFIEFTSPDPDALKAVLINMGFRVAGHHKNLDIEVLQQNRIFLVLNRNPGSFANQFSKLHGPSICATGFRVHNVDHAINEAVKRGGRMVSKDITDHSYPAIYGIGDSLVYFVADNSWHLDYDWHHPQSTDEQLGLGLLSIDHLTNNVPQGDMDKWFDFYSSIFNFREIRFFDIDGKATGLLSRALRSPCNKITIPINEPKQKTSQIQEYLDQYNGPGIQHVAFLSTDILKSVSALKKNNVRFLVTPDTYYEMLPSRVPDMVEDIEALKSLGVLADGKGNRYLLQIFTENMIGPIFFEIIDRKGDDGFGEGNFQALFDSIEEDQRRRGVLA